MKLFPFTARKAAPTDAAAGAPPRAASVANTGAPPAPVIDPVRLVTDLARQASVIGREAAEVRGVMDDSMRDAAALGVALQSIAAHIAELRQAQGVIDAECGSGLAAVGRARDAVAALGSEVAAIVETLREVAAAAGSITQIALQTRLVAFNASVEAKRAGEAGRGFGVVADAVKDLASRVESSSKHIMGTVGRLEGRIDKLARETTRSATASAEQGLVHTALADVSGAVGRIGQAATQGHGLCAGLADRTGELHGTAQRGAGVLKQALVRTDAFLTISEQLIETVAECGVETEDTIYIRAAQSSAAALSALLTQAVDEGSIRLADLFDEQYRPMAGTSPQQHLARFTELADRLFPHVQEPALALSDKVVFCIAADRNGYIACHNRRYNQAQRAGDTPWNTAHCRNRRIFNDRTGLASGRNEKPFLLQTYRRDMGGGQFVVMKEVAAPIRVHGRHWGGMRLAFKF